MIGVWSACALPGDIVEGIVCGPAPGGPALLFAALFASCAAASTSPPVMSAAMAIPSAPRMVASCLEPHEVTPQQANRSACRPQPSQAKIAQHLARSVVAGRPGHPAARVGTG